MVLPFIGHGFSSGSSLLSKWPFYSGGFWGLWVFIWDISQPSCKCGVAEGPGLWVNHNYSACKIELTPSWTCQTAPSHMSYPLHTNLFLSEILWAEMQVLGPKMSSFSVPVTAECCSGFWLNFRKECVCPKSAFVWLWNWRHQDYLDSPCPDRHCHRWKLYVANLPVFL